jgi:voltage-gated potassium channel
MRGSARGRLSASDVHSLGQSVGTVLLLALATFIYYLIPVPGHMRGATWAVIFACGLGVLAVLILTSSLRLLREGLERRARSLIVLLCITVLFFSWADVALAVIPGQFASLHTKTDGLYFSVSTLATVGFGDVHAAGQLARTAVTLQIVFNLVFLGTAVAMISGMFKARARRRVSRPDHEAGSDRGSAG